MKDLLNDLTIHQQVVEEKTGGAPGRLLSLLVPHLHPGGNPGANLKSTYHRRHPIHGAFAWELTKGTINLPLGCLHGGCPNPLHPRRSFLPFRSRGLFFVMGSDETGETRS